MPRYKFRWSNLPESLLDGLCEHLFVDTGGLTPAEALQGAYGARPKENFVVEAWEPLRERWLDSDKPSRDWVVETLHKLRNEDARTTGRRAQMEYLRELRNARTLRAVVLEAFIELGETELSPPEPEVTAPPPPPARIVRKPVPPTPHPGDDVSTPVVDSPQDLNVAPGSIVVIRDEEWLVTSAEQGADGWLVRVRGLSELVAETTAAFYSSLDKIEVQDPSKAKVESPWF